ncbi:hypothetical protein [Fibrobacter succinogenes]|uniref:hypothetical protein n=1 Tax=Fibrobacter succinogenes TaxID=833 RepID=UPI00156890CB|nr:hypothetical protein [Fibrobacter succinogenes]
MDYVIMRPRLVWRLLGLGGLYWIIFSDGFAYLQTENGIFPYLAILAFIALFLFLACQYFVVTKEGLQRGLTFGYMINFLPKKRIIPWEDYAYINVWFVFPFYEIDAFKGQPTYRNWCSFLFISNFLDLIIFINKEIPHNKMDPEYRERFRQLAKKYRKLKKKHRILYWILNNV